MLPESALKEMKVMFATPCYGGQVCANYAASIFSLGILARQLELDCIVSYRNESLITRSRNNLTARFLTNEVLTHLFWIDGDIGFSPEDPIRLLLSDYDVVGQVYPKKTLHWPANGLPQGMTERQFETNYADYPFNPLEYANGKFVMDKNGFAEVLDAPTGFMCIKRSVFLTLMEKRPDLKYEADDNEPEEIRPFFYRFFDCMVDPDTNRYLSEDFAFCRHWRGIGGKIYVDTNSKLTHWGQKLFMGDLPASYQARGKW